MTTAVFVEPRLLKDDLITEGLKSTKFPIYEIRRLEDIKQAEIEDASIKDMYILVILSDFDSDLFNFLKRRLKRREPKATIIGPPYFQELLIQVWGLRIAIQAQTVRKFQSS